MHVPLSVVKHVPSASDVGPTHVIVGIAFVTRNHAPAVSASPHGPTVGAAVGAVGDDVVGATVGTAVGCNVGDDVGAVGVAVGADVGAADVCKDACRNESLLPMIAVRHEKGTAQRAGMGNGDSERVYVSLKTTHTIGYISSFPIKCKQFFFHETFK